MWIIAIILAAFFDSLKTLLGKRVSKQINLNTIIWAQWFFALFLIVPLFIIFKPLPPNDYFWIVLLVNTLLNIIATTLYWKGIMLSDMSLALPIVSLTPMFLLITSPIMTGEFPSFLGILGVLVTIIGTYILNLDKRVIGFWEPLKRIFYEKGLRYAFIVSILWSITSNFDKVAINNSSPITYVAYLYIFMAIFWTLFVMYKRQLKNVACNTHKLLPIGLIAGLAHVLQMYAYLGAIVPYVISVKRINILFGIALGAMVLKEREFSQRFMGGLIMLIGIFVILIFG